MECMEWQSYLHDLVFYLCHVILIRRRALKGFTRFRKWASHTCYPNHELIRQLNLLEQLIRTSKETWLISVDRDVKRNSDAFSSLAKLNSTQVMTGMQ